MHFADIKEKIIAYIDAAYEWHETNEGSLDENPGKLMAELEEEILTAFGLPFAAFKYSDILQQEGFSNTNKEERAEHLMQILKFEAEEFLLVPIEKDADLLNEAKHELKDAVEVLPLIGITTTNYNCFLYYDIFFRGICNAHQILKALKKSEALSWQDLQIIDSIELLNQENNYKSLQLSIPFLKNYKAFINYKRSKHNWNEHNDNYNLDQYVGLPDKFELNHFVIKEIYVENESICCLKILRLLKNTIIEMKLFCQANEMFEILRYAKYYSIAMPILYVIKLALTNSQAITIIAKDAIDNNIEIENINLEISKLYKRNEKNAFDYYVAEIKKDDLPF
jgi:hypothetical protein